MGDAPLRRDNRARKKRAQRPACFCIPRLLLTISAGLQGFVADFKNTGLIGGAAIGQDAGLVLKSFAAVVLHSAVLKLVAHGVGVEEHVLIPNGNLSQTFALAHPALAKDSLKVAFRPNGAVATKKPR